MSDDLTNAVSESSPSIEEGDQSREEGQQPSHYVGIGASAGGLEAIESFFKAMPGDTGAAYIIVQHLSPDYKSLMPELMSRRTTMPVHLIEDDMAVLPDHVYLMPPKKNLKIFHGKLLLSDQDRGAQLNLPIDIFFKSLAEDQGSRAIGVVLSGTGSDGTRGTRAIKEADGMVMAQDEESAKFDGMPRSVIATGLVDFILSPAEMPAQLIGFMRHPYKSKSTADKNRLSNEGGLSRLYGLLREHSRIDFTHYKTATVQRRIERRMMIVQVNDLSEYIRYLETHRHEVDILHRELLIGVTSFFRDPDAFNILGEKQFEEMLERHESRELRVWVAGCSTGEEAYTIAMLLQEAMDRTGRRREVKIFATDVDKNAVDTASVGRYPEGIVADVPPPLLAKYFLRHDTSFQVSRSIREMVVFAQHNLIKDPPFTNIDLISCRNLLIYLQPILQRKVFELFNFSLVKDGLMLLGSSETTGDMSEYFETLNQKWRLYRCIGKKRPTTLSLETTSWDQSRLLRTRLAGSQASVRIQQEEERVLDRFLQAFASDFVLFAMALNANLEVVHALGDTGTFLKMPPGSVTIEANRLVPKELAVPVSTGVQKVLKSGQPMTFSRIRISLEGEAKMLQMRIKPLTQKKGQDPLVGVFLYEQSSASESTAPLGESVPYDMSSETEERINDLEQELQFTRENLQATVEELETSNEELQATNEELLASNEELQSTNEELQSVNEELYTVNAEYQTKITELTEANNDLDNLLSSSHIGSLFLDEDLEIRRFSKSVAKILNIIDADIGRPVEHISSKVQGLNIHDIASRVLSSESMDEYEFQAEDGRWHLLRAVPYRIASQVYAGAVLLFFDITEQKIVQTDLLSSRRRDELAHKTFQMGTWEWDAKSNAARWSPNLPGLLGLNGKSFGGTFEHFIELVHPADRVKVQKCLEVSLRTRSRLEVEYRVVHSDDSVRWMQSQGAFFEGGMGQTDQMIGIVRDVTERRNLEVEVFRMSRRGGVVLLIDDDPEMIEFLRMLLESIPEAEDTQLLTASNGYEGLILAGRYSPLLIVSDLLMPGMDGFRMLHAMEVDPLLRNIPRVVLTSMEDPEIRKHGGVPDAVQVFKKGSKVELLVGHLTARLRESKARYVES